MRNGAKTGEGSGGKDVVKGRKLFWDQLAGASPEQSLDRLGSSSWVDG